MRLLTIFILGFIVGVVAAGCAPDLATSESALSVDAQVAVTADPYPESDECGYARRLLGTTNGRPIYGPPILEQNNCQSGLVCGRPDLDSCTPYEAEHLTCGCVAVATACNVTEIAAGLKNPTFRVREDSEARAVECCAKGPAGFVSDLTRTVDALGSPEASMRLDRIRGQCLRCTMAFVSFGQFFDAESSGYWHVTSNTCGDDNYCDETKCATSGETRVCSCGENPTNGAGQPSYCDVSSETFSHEDGRGPHESTPNLVSYQCRDDQRCDADSADCQVFQEHVRTGPFGSTRTEVKRCPCKGPAYPNLADGFCRFLTDSFGRPLPAGNNCPDGYSCSSDAGCTTDADGVRTCACTPNRAPAAPVPGGL